MVDKSKVIETIIIGGGISGLACARRLADCSKEFLLVTDRLGGRMYHSHDGSMNFGASYVNQDYRNILKYVDRGQPFRLWDAHSLNGGKLTRLIRFGNARSLRPFFRLVKALQRLRKSLKQFRRAAEHTPQKDLLPKFPLIEKLSKMPATEFIDNLRLWDLNERYFRSAFMTTCFVETKEAKALFYLGSLLPIVARTWIADFSKTYEKLTAGITERITIDRATEITKSDTTTWQVQTSNSYTFDARNIVIAVPFHNASKLWNVPKPHLVKGATICFVRGKRRVPFRNKTFMFFRPEDTGLTLVWQLHNGVDQVFSASDSPKLDEIYDSHTVVGTTTWKTAVMIPDENWTPMMLEPNLFLIGDYNLCTLEDTFTTGICAANNIIKCTSKSLAGS